MVYPELARYLHDDPLGTLAANLNADRDDVRLNIFEGHEFDWCWKVVEAVVAGQDIHVPKDPIPADQAASPELKELLGKVEAQGESDLRGHIKGQSENDEGSGSVAYVPPEAKDDIQLQYALELLRGQKTDPAFPPNPEKAVMNQ